MKLLDTHCAITTIRLWHELHVAKKIPHDFQDLLDVKDKNSIFIGAIRNNEVRAIAQCRRHNLAMLKVKKIAHAPEQPNAASILLIKLQNETVPDWNTIKSQPRWYYEELFLLSNFDKD